MIVPPPVRPGDRVRVVAPSGPFPTEEFDQGLAWLSSRYSVTFDPQIRSRVGFLAGDDTRRLNELNAALEDPDARAVVMARGGHGLIRIIAQANLDALRASPKWLVGYSDITLLHLEANRAGVASVHGDNLTGLGRSNPQAQSEWSHRLEQAGARHRLEGLETWHGGRARGTLRGGNLSLLFVAAASGRLNLPNGCILLLEDVTESPYRIDRMLSALKLGRHLDPVGAIVLGDMTDCQGPEHHPTVWDVLREQLFELAVPLVRGAKVGHGPQNLSLTLGMDAELDAAAGLLQTGLAPKL